MMSPFKALLGYYPRMSSKDDHDPRSKSRLADKNAMAFCNLVKELKANLAESQESQMLYHHKNVKIRLYRLREFIWLSGKHIKTKQNPKLKQKYLGPFEILEAAGKQAYRLKLSAKWRIHLMFYISLLERDLIRREVVDQKMQTNSSLKKKNN